jgi:hypothetical protein
MADNAAGFGATNPTTDNDAEIRRLLEQARDLMIESGVDPATAEAQIGFAMPAAPAVAGNLADLNRMGQVVVQGRIDTPVGQEDEETSSLEAAFKEPPAAPTAEAGTGLQTPLGSIDAEGRPTGGTEEGVAAADPEGDAGGDTGDGGDTDWNSRTKAEIQAELDSRGVEYNSGDTKADLIARLEEG